MAKRWNASMRSDSHLSQFTINTVTVLGNLFLFSQLVNILIILGLFIKGNSLKKDSESELIVYVSFDRDWRHLKVDDLLDTAMA
jgi:hypothetical protein